MATRPNKKRKGRTNAPPRERTVTTLTHASAGPFSLPPPTLHDDLSAPDLVAAAAAQRSAAAAALLSPHLSYSVSPPIANFSDHWNALSAPPPSYPLSFSSNLNTYNPMTPILGGPYPPQHSPPHYFPRRTLSSHRQSDLEILEKLKETIKKNQHDIFRPVPQPAALASVYLGPKPPLPSLVPPHPEQLPVDASPPGLNLYADHTSAQPKSVAAPPKPLSPAVSPASPPVLSQRPDVPNTPARRSTASDSPKLNAPPVKRHVDTHDSGASFSHKTHAPLVASVPSAKQPDVQDISPPGLHRYEPAGRLSPVKNSRNELSTSPVISHDTPIAKEDARALEPGWGSRNGTDGRQHYQADRPPRARPVPESPVTADQHRPANGSGTRVLPPREQRIQDRDREPEKNKEHERDRARPPPRDHPGRDDRPRTADSRRLSRSPDAARRFESRFPPRRYSKASETSFTSPRLSDRSPPKPGPPRNLGEERAIVRPPPAATASRPSLPDERRVPPPSMSAEERAARPPALDDRRGPAVPLVADRASNDSRPRPLSPLPDRAGRRRPPSPPANERAGIGHDDRRRAHTPPLNDRLAAHLDVRREPVPPSPLVPLERSPRLPAADDRRVVPSSGERPGLPSSAEDRRPSGAADRPPKSAVPDERLSRTLYLPAPFWTNAARALRRLRIGGPVLRIYLSKKDQPGAKSA
ncbi:hypothetical protein BN946_scf184497.g5 [Trametes cinnabarina]|uniref:Uncharacterized protein n=1 Tax=Pycnoporus cinnabarinus TaxID=5643 RepID=A0A060SSU6_PYCCI|nr:hypothetical protein BN946_scf184497.g5 [Trametes cinnabarina]